VESDERRLKRRAALGRSKVWRKRNGLCLSLLLLTIPAKAQQFAIDLAFDPSEYTIPLGARYLQTEEASLILI